ncbi:MAG: CopG family transcriptional regulator [Candidatus Pseudoruminococcus sp.]|nr:CopG family transcriptional regulator [Ruminococcus sp.]MDY2782400.1 CopG family transcriptional regulator [Candidatus Pseudoruminococcus sp.]
MSPRTGRPKVDKPLTVEVKARIDVETNKKLIDYCEKNGVTRTEVVRQGIEYILDKKK